MSCPSRSSSASSSRTSRKPSRAPAASSKAGWTRWRVFALWSKVVAVSVVAAAVGWGLLDVIGTGGGAFALAFAGGALLVMLADTLMPEAFDLGGREAGLLTALGFALGFALS